MNAIELGPLALAIKQNLTAFFAWWAQALVAAVPRAVRDALTSRRERIFIRVGIDEIIVTRRTRNADTVVAQIKRGDMAAVSALRSATTSHVGADATVYLVDGLALRRRIVLPAAAEPELARILENEIDRQTPFSADQVYFDFRIAARDRVRKEIAVDLMVAKRAVIAEALAFGATEGWPVARVGVLAQDGTPLAVDLLRRVHRAGARARLRRVNAALAILAFVLAGAALYASYDRLAAAAARAAAEADAARQHFARAEALQREIDKLEKQVGAVARRKQAGSPLRALKDITTRLPDSVWIFHLQIARREVRIAGYAADAPALISVFEASEVFENPRFRAPVTRGNTNVDRFDLSLDIRPGVLP